MKKIKLLIASVKNLAVVKNSMWNIIGQLIPLLAALVAIPILIKTIGNERFGFLSIAWMLIGYFSLFDFGIGRAITYAIANRLAKGREDVADILWTGLSFIFIIGVAVSVIILIWGDWIIYSFIKLSPELEDEANNALKILSVSIPFVIVTTGLRGALEGLREFRIINLWMIPLGSLLFIAPAIMSQFQITLEYIILSLFVVRSCTFITFIVLCYKKVNNFLQWQFKKETLKELIRFGGWMTVSNVVSPIMVNMDRIFIGAQMAVSSVTFYVVPFDIVSKVLMLPSAIAGAIFPEFSHLIATNQRGKLKAYLTKGVLIIALMLAFPLSIIFFGAHEILSWWISEELANESSNILRVLCIGILINGICYMPFAFIQGMGKSDVTAKFHVIELCIYGPLLYTLLGSYGLIGVAFAWVIRVAIDALLLFGYSFLYLKK